MFISNTREQIDERIEVLLIALCVANELVVENERHGRLGDEGTNPRLWICWLDAAVFSDALRHRIMSAVCVVGELRIVRDKKAATGAKPVLVVNGRCHGRKPDAVEAKVIPHESTNLVIVCAKVKPFPANYCLQQWTEQGECTSNGDTTPAKYDNRTEVFHSERTKRHE